MKPPIIKVAPSGTEAIASSIGTFFIGTSPPADRRQLTLPHSEARRIDFRQLMQSGFFPPRLHLAYCCRSVRPRDLSISVQSAWIWAAGRVVGRRPGRYLRPGPIRGRVALNSLGGEKQ